MHGVEEAVGHLDRAGAVDRGRADAPVVHRVGRQERRAASAARIGEVLELGDEELRGAAPLAGSAGGGGARGARRARRGAGPAPRTASSVVTGTPPPRRRARKVRRPDPRSAARRVRASTRAASGTCRSGDTNVTRRTTRARPRPSRPRRRRMTSPAATTTRGGRERVCGGATARRPGGAGAREERGKRPRSPRQVYRLQNDVRGATSRFADTSTLAMLSIARAPRSRSARASRLASRRASLAARRLPASPRRRRRFRPLKDLSNLDKDLAKVSPSAMADALSATTARRGRSRDRDRRDRRVRRHGLVLLTLRDTGCGLPPGPLGLVGAAEGVSYLYPRARRVERGEEGQDGSGPRKPGGVLGLAEGSRTSSHSPASPCSWDRSKITGSSRTPSRSRGAVLRAVTDRVFHFHL